MEEDFYLSNFIFSTSICSEAYIKIFFDKPFKFYCYEYFLSFIFDVIAN